MLLCKKLSRSQYRDLESCLDHSRGCDCSNHRLSAPDISLDQAPGILTDLATMREIASTPPQAAQVQP